jgi:YHS domain-containing protein
MDVTDPVCGMKIDIESAAAIVEHDGWVHLFCSAESHRLFAAHPERYVTISVLATASTAQHRHQTVGGEDE